MGLIWQQQHRSRSMGIDILLYRIMSTSRTVAPECRTDGIWLISSWAYISLERVDPVFKNLDEARILVNKRSWHQLNNGSKINNHSLRSVLRFDRRQFANVCRLIYSDQVTSSHLMKPATRGMKQLWDNQLPMSEFVVFLRYEETTTVTEQWRGYEDSQGMTEWLLTNKETTS